MSKKLLIPRKEMIVSEGDFKLPASTLAEIEKIIQAYAERGQPSTNDEVAQIAGISATTLSRNNGFLASIDLIKGGQKKEPTELGSKLGHALHHNQAEDAQRYWREAVMASSFLSEQLTAVRVQKGVKTDTLPSKVLYNSKSKKTQYTETGSRTIVEIFVKAGLLVEENGNYQVPKEGAAIVSPAALQLEEPARDIEPSRRAQPSQPQSRALQIAVNLQIQLPDFEDPKKYSELFRALREELLDPPDSQG